MNTLVIWRWVLSSHRSTRVITYTSRTAIKLIILNGRHLRKWYLALCGFEEMVSSSSKSTTQTLQWPVFTRTLCSPLTLKIKAIFIFRNQDFLSLRRLQRRHIWTLWCLRWLADGSHQWSTFPQGGTSRPLRASCSFSVPLCELSWSPYQIILILSLLEIFS